MAKLKIPTYQHRKPTKGLVFIGDPHIWSHKPGRRRDENYLNTLIGKLIWSARYANEHDLWPVILGDLLHESSDNDLGMISKLVDAMQHFERKPFVMVGNHDLTEKTLTPGTVLHLLAQTEQIHAMVDNSPMALIPITQDGQTSQVLLGGTPYGEQIPVSLAKWVAGKIDLKHDDIKKDLGVDKVVWITHEDLAFDSNYPGALALFPIEGVDLVVNGHMHATQKPIRKGCTSWYNPGNITRLTIDLIEHIPKIWTWSPFDTRTQAGADGIDVPVLDGIVIPHVEGHKILSLEGRAALIEEQHKVVIADDEPSADTSSVTSEFVKMIKNDEQTERTDDGVFLAQSIQEELDHINPPAHIKDIVIRLFDQTIAHHRDK